MILITFHFSSFENLLVQRCIGWYFLHTTVKYAREKPELLHSTTQRNTIEQPRAQHNTQTVADCYDDSFVPVDKLNIEISSRLESGRFVSH